MVVHDEDGFLVLDNAVSINFDPLQRVISLCHLNFDVLVLASLEDDQQLILIEHFDLVFKVA